MTHTLYLAMTAAEMQNAPALPKPMAWMACHFSPYGNALSNLPPALPPGSALILNDRIPPSGHDPHKIARQITQIVQQLQISRVLLDLQRPECPLTAEIAQAVTADCPCPCGVTPQYARELSCAVFITPALHRPLQEQAQDWPGRQIWLEAALDCACITVTGTGSKSCPAQIPADTDIYHTDPLLRCSYTVAVEADHARFTLWRDRQQLIALLEHAATLGIDCAIGLYQQLHKNTAEAD